MRGPAERRFLMESCLSLSSKELSLSCNFIVPAPKELYATEPVAKWINHQCQPTPFVSRDGALEPSTRIHRLPDG
jgi:hypothetical protein